MANNNNDSSYDIASLNKMLIHTMLKYQRYDTAILQEILYNYPLTANHYFLLDYAVEEKPSHISVMQQLEDGGPDPLVFVLNANLLSMVKIVNCKSNHFKLW